MEKYLEIIKPAERLQPKDTAESADIARELFDALEIRERIPLFWSLIKNDRGNLVAIFRFFFETRKLRESDEGMRLIDYLWNRLSSRWTSRPAIATASEARDVRRISEKLVAAIDTLEKNSLFEPAFELFSAGALTPRGQFDSKQDERHELINFDRRVYPEPDGASFFFWAEFGLAATELGCDTDVWIRVLPELLRAERIFVLCYGPSGNQKKRRFSDYFPVSFDAIHPIVAQGIVRTLSTDLQELELEQTACAKFAFPGEDWATV